MITSKKHPKLGGSIALHKACCHRDIAISVVVPCHPGGTTDIPLPEEIKGMNAQEVVARDSLFCPASVPTIMSVIPVALKYTPCGAMALTELPKEKSSRSESLRHDLICKFAK
jgi:hypothetical protein